MYQQLTQISSLDRLLVDSQSKIMKIKVDSQSNVRFNFDSETY